YPVVFAIRISSLSLHDALPISRIFKDYSLEATIVGCCSSPMLYFTARQFDGNGIMVTASHNPKEDNGIKWTIDGEPPCPEMIQQDRKSTRLNSSHVKTSYAVFC